MTNRTPEEIARLTEANQWMPWFKRLTASEIVEGALKRLRADLAVRSHLESHPK